MKVLARLSSRHFEPNITNRRDAAINRHFPASLPIIAILIVSTSISVVAAPGAAHRGRLYVVSDGAAGTNNPRPAREAQKASGSDSSLLDQADRAINVSFQIAQGMLEPVWDAALWVSQQALAILASSGLDPNAADHGIMPSVDNNRAASAIAFGLIGVLLFGTVGPLYYSWKLRRLRLVRRFR
jgi:hypothetical protein